MILAKNHLDKYVKYYDDLCENFEDILDRIKNLHGRDIIKNRTYYSSTTKCLDSFIDAMESLNWKIEGVNKQDINQNHWYSSESDLKDAFKRCQDKYVGLVNSLENLESRIAKSEENV
jgi:Mg2+ and Co2+ transporter CorA